MTLTATVDVAKPGAGTPTGSVTFESGGTILGTAALTTFNGITTAEFVTTTLAVGAHQIFAVYGGDMYYGTSESPVVAVTIQQTTTTTAKGLRSATVYGQPAAFTATVKVVNPGTGAPTARFR